MEPRSLLAADAWFDAQPEQTHDGLESTESIAQIVDPGAGKIFGSGEVRWEEATEALPASFVESAADAWDISNGSRAVAARHDALWSQVEADAFAGAVSVTALDDTALDGITALDGGTPSDHRFGGENGDTIRSALVSTPNSRVRMQRVHGARQNSDFPEDTNLDGVATPLDALLIINAFNPRGARRVAELPTVQTAVAMLDVDGDSHVSQADARLVIDYLNQHAEPNRAALNQSTPENVVVIMVDDLSLDAFEALFDSGWLPNLTSLAADGVAFENSFVTNSACCPSRATFLTGQYSHNHGVLSNISPDPFRAGMAWPGWLATETTPGRNESTIATWLHDAGYRTALIGKYLNGYGDVAPEGVPDPALYIPPGWDDWQGLVGISTYSIYDYTINDNGTLVTYGDSEPDYQTDVIASRAVDFIDAAQTDPSTPFFLKIAPLAPHLEVTAEDGLRWLTTTNPRELLDLDIRVAPRHAHLVDGDPANDELPSFVEKPSFNEEDLSDKPTCTGPPPPTGEVTYWTVPNCVGNSTEPFAEADIDHLRRQFKSIAGSMLAVDDLVGAVMAALNESGVLDSTTVIFTSDNGVFAGEHQQSGKLFAYEESIRVPLIIRSPGTATGAIATQIVLNNDLAPTIADLAGVTPPYEPDGSSLLPIFQDPDNAEWSRTTFLVENFFIPSIYPYQPATFFAIRHLDSLDFLYVTTRAEPQQLSNITHREFYHHAADPYQIESFQLATDVTDVLDNITNALRSCEGASCKTFESLLLGRSGGQPVGRFGTISAGEPNI